MKSEVYAIAINQNQSWNDPDVFYEAARIIKKDTGETVISVFYCKNAYKKTGYHFLSMRFDNNTPGIVHDDLYIDLSNIALMILRYRTAVTIPAM